MKVYKLNLKRTNLICKLTKNKNRSTNNLMESINRYKFKSKNHQSQKANKKKLIKIKDKRIRNSQWKKDKKPETTNRFKNLSYHKKWT